MANERLMIKRQTRKNRLTEVGVLLVACALLLFTVSGPAWSAEEAGEATEAAEDYMLEETTVTATKTGETLLQETSIAISAFDKEALDRAGIIDVQNLDLVTPNMITNKDTRSAVVYMRGVGSNAFFSGSHDSVGIYVDDAYTPRNTGLYSSLLDTERVEVLRGPQGTLYGRNTSGGAVRVMTAMPTEEISGYAMIEFGTENKYGFNGALSGPITNNLKGRIAFLKMNRDGFYDNKAPLTPDTADDRDWTGARIKLQFTPSENLDFVLTGEYHNLENEGDAPFQFEDPAPFVAAGAQPFKPLDFVTTNPYGNERGVEQETERVSLTGNFDLPRGISLKSVTTYNEHVWSGSSDLDGTTLDLLDILDQKQAFKSFTQEFQLNGQWGDLTLVGGLFYLHENEYNRTKNRVDYVLIVHGDQHYGIEGDSYAAYLTGKYDLTERLSMSAGIRYSYDERENFIDNKTVLDLSPLFGFPLGSVMVPSFYSEIDDESWSNLSPKVSLDYRLTEDVFLYASFTGGYKAGGWNSFAATEKRGSFDPEKVWSYEVGVKSDWLDRRLRVNLALFYYDYIDMQLSSFGLDASGIYSVTIRNATDSDVYGGELDVMARPVPNLTLGVSLASTFGEYGSFEGDDTKGNIVNLAGKTLVFAPEWSVSAYGQYVVTVKDYGFVSFNANYSWQDEYFPEMSNTYIIDARGILDARLVFETTDGKWSLDVYGKNLTDERYRTEQASFIGLGGIATADNPIGVLVSDGLNFGVRLRYRF
ncbi:MAG: TonB-dependent receptor [Deltaproteobacteria bacterium]|nr:TonB-dependent receptor [Deltaproteobacteria bacterium]